MDVIATVFGAGTVVLSVAVSVPQYVRSHRNGDVSGVSLPAAMNSALSFLAWTLYASWVGDGWLIASSALGLPFAIVMGRGGVAVTGRPRRVVGHRSLVVHSAAQLWCSMAEWMESGGHRRWRVDQLVRRSGRRQSLGHQKRLRSGGRFLVGAVRRRWAVPRLRPARRGLGLDHLWSRGHHGIGRCPGADRAGTGCPAAAPQAGRRTAEHD
jgi:uncharacterized protein with PQ loop repeat